MPTSASRPLDFRIAVGLPLLMMALLLLLEPAGLDFALARLFYIPQQGFVGKASFWLEDILHDRAKQVVICLGLLTLAGFLLSLLPGPLRTWRHRLGYLVLALGLATSVVTPLKAITAVHCPWSLSEFGGVERYTPLLSERAQTLKPGRCWPGGHASAGFSLLAFYFVLRDRRPRAAQGALALALGLGMLFSLGRMMQGAHFFSHNLWTLLIDWLICVGAYRLVLYRKPERNARAEVPRQAGADTHVGPM